MRAPLSSSSSFTRTEVPSSASASSSSSEMTKKKDHSLQDHLSTLLESRKTRNTNNNNTTATPIHLHYVYRGTSSSNGGGGPACRVDDETSNYIKQPYGGGGQHERNSTALRDRSSSISRSTTTTMPILLLSQEFNDDEEEKLMTRRTTDHQQHSLGGDASHPLSSRTRRTGAGAPRRRLSSEMVVRQQQQNSSSSRSSSSSSSGNKNQDKSPTLTRTGKKEGRLTKAEANRTVVLNLLCGDYFRRTCCSPSKDIAPVKPTQREQYDDDDNDAPMSPSPGGGDSTGGGTATTTTTTTSTSPSSSLGNNAEDGGEMEEDKNKAIYGYGEATPDHGKETFDTTPLPPSPSSRSGNARPRRSSMKKQQQQQQQQQSNGRYNQSSSSRRPRPARRASTTSSFGGGEFAPAAATLNVRSAHPQRRRRSITFNETTNVRHITPARKLVDDELDHLWFNKDDMKRMKRKAMKIGELADKNHNKNDATSPSTNRKYCLRGLEGYMVSTSITMSERIDEARNMVLGGQQLIRRRSGDSCSSGSSTNHQLDGDDERLARVYQFATMGTRQEANERALQDEAAVKKYLRDTRRLEQCRRRLSV